MRRPRCRETPDWAMPRMPGQFADVQALGRQQPQKPQPGVVAEQPEEAGRLWHIYKSTLMDQRASATPVAGIRGSGPEAPAVRLCAALRARRRRRKAKADTTMKSDDVLDRSPRGGAWCWRMGPVPARKVRSWCVSRAAWRSAHISAATFDFPYITAGQESARPGARARGRVARGARRQAQTEFQGLPLVIGGKSMGGRIASHIAAQGVRRRERVRVSRLPTAPAGKPEQRRDAHLPSIKERMLFVQGTRDAFGDSPRKFSRSYRRSSAPSSTRWKAAITRSRCRGGRAIVLEGIMDAVRGVDPQVASVLTSSVTFCAWRCCASSTECDIVSDCLLLGHRHERGIVAVKRLQLFLVHVLAVDQPVAGAGHRRDELVQFEMHAPANLCSGSAG